MVAGPCVLIFQSYKLSTIFLKALTNITMTIDSLIKMKQFCEEREALHLAQSKSKILIASPGVGVGRKEFPVELIFTRAFALVHSKEAVCGGEVNVGKLCLKSADFGYNHNDTGAYVRNETLYLRAAKKGSQLLSAVFMSYQLDTSKIEKDLVDYLVKLDVGDDLGDP